jgi:hypothetical protein
MLKEITAITSSNSNCVAIILYGVYIERSRNIKYPTKSSKQNKHSFGGVLQFVNKYQLQFSRISSLVLFNNIF